MKDDITYTAIGTIRTPFSKSEGMPIQSKFSSEVGIIQLKKDYKDAVDGLIDFSHLILIYHFHKAKKPQLRTKPFLSKQEQGLFSIRAPNRPNPIGISVVRIKTIKETKEFIEITFEGADMLDNTPLLDIKPYFSEFDSYPDTKNGWYDRREIKETTADNRFSEQ